MANTRIAASETKPRAYSKRGQVSEKPDEKNTNSKKTKREPDPVSPTVACPIRDATTPATDAPSKAVPTVTPAPVSVVATVPKENYFQVEKVTSSISHNGIRMCLDQSRQVLGTYATEEEGIQAAKEARDDCFEFQGWASSHYGDKPPPYSSKAGHLYGYESDGYSIHIYCIDTTPKRMFGNQTPLGLTLRELQENKMDESIFYRNPSLVPGGKSLPPSLYGRGHGQKNSFPFLMQRVSNRNYTMRSLCMDKGSAQFYTFPIPHAYTNQVGWMPDTNLQDHAKDETIADCCHLDLVNTGTVFQLLLTSENLKATVKPDTTCIFLDEFNDYDALADVIGTCADSLQCISLTATVLSSKVLDALSKCPKLSGITIATEDKPSEKCANDKGLATLLKACSATLKWIFVDSWIFDTESWRALGNNDFPLLEVLWVNNTTSDGSRRGIAVGDHIVIRSALKVRGPSLKLCMVNPNKSIQSRFVVGKKSDLLNGNKIR